MLNVMENNKFSADKHTPIQYPLRKEEAPTTTADIPSGLNRIEVWALRVH